VSLFWGKLKQDKKTGEILARLALADHCLDVAMVFRQLCELPAIHRTLNRATGKSLTSRQLDRLGVFAFAHDIGKCNWGFQAKQDPQAHMTAGHVRETLPLFFDPSLASEFYQIFDCDRLIRWVDGPESVFRLFLAAISHHGRPAFTTDEGVGLNSRAAVKFWRTNKNIDPMEGLRELFAAAGKAFPDAFEEAVGPIPVTKTLQHHFAGLVMLADWLGSHSEAFFPFHHRGNRVDWSSLQARQALKTVGLDVGDSVGHITAQRLDFQGIFGFSPYPLQTRLFRADLPPLLVAESDTGSGKTEAALFHFLSLFAAGEVDSLYFALPTRVAARELYDRVLKTMRRAFGDDCPPVLLAVPGYTRIDGEPANALPSEDRLFFESGQHRHERQWAAERPKRFLAAAVAVGTIDQALLSTMRVGHAHLRRICLDRSLLVIDEVHSSDVYMRALARRMIAEHLKVGARALLLSATLGSAARQEYLQLEGFADEEPFRNAVALPYPSVSAPGMVTEDLANPGCRIKNVRIEPLPMMEKLDALLPRLEQAVSSGLRVMVVLNTVKRAVYLCKKADGMPLLASVLFSFNGAACPHHGRFARTDREVLDKEVSRRLGKGSPTGALLLIGTQTLEQSLDIDADWLVTDLCPIDVLLQRIGRLHRHDRGQRPLPVCSVLLPETDNFNDYLRQNGEVAFGAPAGMGTVYEDLRIFQLTRDLVAKAPLFELPRENRWLVETATHPEKIASLGGERWLNHGLHIQGKIQAMLMAADSAVIPEAHFGDFSFPSSLDTRLMTRLGLDDRRLSLGGIYTGPFGPDVQELVIPGHMARGLDQEKADSVQVAPEGLVIRAGRYAYLYSRFGLERIDEPAHG
jgi:CRISPR-associated endonuclease/helicase Cas3